MSVKIDITCQISELPTLTGFIIASYTRNQADFQAYSPDFNAAFLTNLKAKNDALQTIINPKQVTAELKLITDRIYRNQIALRQPIDFIEGYINRASNLSMAAKDFGVGAIRKANNRGNIEDVTSSINYLLSNVKKNKTILTAKGLTDGLQDNIQRIHDQLLADNIAQNQKIGDRKALVEKNYASMNALWQILIDICDTGKRLYKTAAPYKLQDYTIKRLIAQLRNNDKQTKIIGKVTFNAAPAPKAVITLQPIDGGRNRIIKLNADATFSKIGIPQDTYKATCTLANTTPQSTIFTLETNSDFDLNFDLQ